MTKDALRTDEFGFGASMIASFESFCLTQRGTGRTTRILDTAKPGDLIVTRDPNMLKFYDRELATRKLKEVSILVIDENAVDSSLEEALRRRFAGRQRPTRIRFDESFIEAFLRRRVYGVATALSDLESRYTDSDEVYEQYTHDRLIEERYQRSVSYARI